MLLGRREWLNFSNGNLRRWRQPRSQKKQHACGRFRLGRVQFSVVGLVEGYPVPLLVHKEVAPVSKAVVHFLQCVNDEIDGCVERPCHAIFAHESVIELHPVFDPVGQPLVVDYDKQIIVRPVAFGGMSSSIQVPRA